MHNGVTRLRYSPVHSTSPVHNVSAAFCLGVLELTSRTCLAASSLESQLCGPKKYVARIGRRGGGSYRITAVVGESLLLIIAIYDCLLHDNGTEQAVKLYIETLAFYIAGYVDGDDIYVDMRRSVVAKTVPDGGSQNLAQEDPLKDEPYVKMNPAALPHQSMAAEVKTTASLLPPPSSPAPIYELLLPPRGSASVPMPSSSPSSGSDSLYYASRDMLELKNSWSRS